MIDRRLALIGLPAGAATLYFAAGLFTSTEIEFTRAAPAAPPALDMRPAVSTAFLDLPVDLHSVARRTEAALAQRLASLNETAQAASDPACTRRPAPPACYQPRLSASVSQTAPVDIETRGAAIKIRVPVRIETAPSAPQSHQSPERAHLDATITFQYVARTLDSGLVELVRREDSAPENLSPAASPADLRLVRQTEGQLRPIAIAAHDELRRVFTALPVEAATERAWKALSSPMELGAGTGVWLRAIPELVGPGQLVSQGQSIALRIPIAAKLSIEEGQRPAQSPRRPAIHGQILTESGARIRVASRLSLSSLQGAAESALVRGGPLEMRPDRFGPPIKVEFKSVRSYPSLHQVGFEMLLAASRYEGETFRGKAHLVGRPQLDAATGLVTLADLALTPPPARESAAGKIPRNAPRLGSEPIVARLGTHTRIDITRDLEEAVPRYNGMLHQRIDDRLALSARIEKASPAAIETSQAGLWMLADLTGALIMTFDPGTTLLAPAEVASSPPQARTPSPAVSATGAAAATIATTAAQVVKSASPPAPPSQFSAQQPATIAPPPQTIAQPTTATAAGGVTSARSPEIAPPPSAEAAAPAPKPRAASIKPKVPRAKPASKIAEGKTWVPFAQ